MEEQEPVLVRLENIYKRFGSKVVLRNFSLLIHPGGNTLIQGPSGSGKTTILRVILLLEKVNSGTIWYNETDVTKYAGQFLQASRVAKLQIGYVSQNLDLWAHLRVEENIGLPLRLRGVRAEDVEAKISDVLRALGIWEERRAYPAFLSGGQRQRVAIARSLVHSPSILLLDEIVSNLDRDNAQKVFRIMEEISAAGTTLVMVSHAKDVPGSLFETRVLLE
jgi:ABC-type lipoprotein export system ATPase subunit